MNPNRQNNRYITPGGPGFGGCPGGRPVTTAGCAVAVNDCCNPCGTGVVGGIIVGQQVGEGCGGETVLQGMPLAMAYVPWQNYGNIYSMQQALQRGTIFQELDLDFAGRRCN